MPLGPWAAAAILTLQCSNSSALTINSEFIGDGEPFGYGIGVVEDGTAPSNVVGGGNLTTVFDAAANFWEQAILDDHSISIQYGWAPLDGSTFGYSVAYDLPPVDEGVIRFDNDETTEWFVDPTPTDNSEYSSHLTESQDLGGGEVNTRNRYIAEPGDTGYNNVDLYTLALHEIGHLMGVLDFNWDPLNDPLVIGDDLPFSGTTIQTTTTGGGHIDHYDHDGPVMTPYFSASERTLLTDLDILAAAEMSDFTNVDLSMTPTPVPIPGSLLFLGSGLAALVMVRKR